MIEQYILQPLREIRARIEEQELARVEAALQDSAVLLASILIYDSRVPPIVKKLWKKQGRLTPEREKELLFIAYATIYIPDGAGDNVALLRTMFGKGSFRLFRRQTLRDLSLENGLSWRDGLKYYRRAAEIASDNQIARARFELTGRT